MLTNDDIIKSLVKIGIYSVVILLKFSFVTLPLPTRWPMDF